jgi:hypothetical protein
MLLNLGSVNWLFWELTRNPRPQANAFMMISAAGRRGRDLNQDWIATKGFVAQGHGGELGLGGQ